MGWRLASRAICPVIAPKLLWFPGRRVSRHCPGDPISFATLLGNFYTNCSQKFNLNSSHRRLTRVPKVKQMDYSILEMGRVR
ncbi:hypothetical protein TNCV_1280571 [Trichonephila clavipes]|nr:hypothetical protein TNCV_1280571 [Trichonephila clavipes]